MDKIRLGRTNLKVTQLGWGSIPLQRVSEEEAVAVVKAVVEMGVDLLDTARGYTTSEARIGLALKSLQRPVVLSSKSPVRTDKIYEEVHVSLKNLQVRKIPIYHLHNVSKMEDYEKVMGPGGAYEGPAESQKRRFDRSYRFHQPQSGCHGKGAAGRPFRGRHGLLQLP